MPIGENETQIPGCYLSKSRLYRSPRHTLYSGPPAVTYIPQPMHDDVFSENVGQTGYRLPVDDRLLEGFSETGGSQESKVGVRCLARIVCVAVTVDGDYVAVALLANYAVRVHAEGPHLILKVR